MTSSHYFLYNCILRFPKLLFDYCEIYAELFETVAHSALPTYNAALNRPAYQSSVHVEGRGSYNASFANDGNHETNGIKDNKPWCSVSENEPNSWWAVDLGHPTTVYRVDLTNTGGFGNQFGGDRGGMYLFSLEFRWVR